MELQTLAAFAEIVIQDTIRFWVYSFMASSHLTPACYPMDRMLISVRRPLSDCSLNNSPIDLWCVADMQLSDVWACL